jgi:hypothetical protein
VYPACVEVNQPAAFTNSLSGRIEGGVGILKHGEGYFTLEGRDFASCGDIGVDGGTLEIASDATWLNGTNVYVSGSGTLKLGASNRFNARFAQLHLGDDSDSWQIDIPAGCLQIVDCVWDVQGCRLPCGVYGAEGVPGVDNARYAGHFPRSGVIKVRRHGFAVCFR